MYSKKEREIYSHDRDITCDRLGITKNQYNWFRRKGQALRKIYEDQCNGDETEAIEREEQVLTDAVIAEAKNLGLHIHLQTDPRGATIYLGTTEIPENNYNTSAHCIY